MADNWASHNPGVVVVFCIIALVVLGIIFFQVAFRCKEFFADEQVQKCVDQRRRLRDGLV